MSSEEFTVKHIWWILLLLGAGVGPAMAQFDTGRYYLHFKIMDASYDDPSPAFLQRLSSDFAIDGITSVQFDEPDFAFSVTEGLLLTRYFGVEAGLTYYGEPDALVIHGNGEVVRVNHQYFGGQILAVGQYPISKNISAFVRGGAAYWRGEFDIASVQSGGLLESHATGIEFTGGGGVRALFGLVSLELAYDQATIDDMDLSGITFGMGFRY